MQDIASEKADVRLSIETQDFFTLNDELIVFSPTKGEYFGIDGAAKVVFSLIAEAQSPLTEQEIVNRIGAGHTLTAAEMSMVQDAVRLLLELGVLNEK
jgi:hypothetical protein